MELSLRSSSISLDSAFLTNCRASLTALEITRKAIQLPNIVHK